MFDINIDYRIKLDTYMNDKHCLKLLTVTRYLCKTYIVKVVILCILVKLSRYIVK